MKQKKNGLLVHVLAQALFNNYRARGNTAMSNQLQTM